MTFGELVGDPTEYNPQRRDDDISVDVEGVTAALNGSSAAGVRQDDQSLSVAEVAPESGAQHTTDDHRTDVSTTTKPPLMNCPVDGCDYKHLSSQGLCGHIAGKQENHHHWDRIDLTEADLHELDDRGTHPDEQIQSLLDGDGNSRIGTTDYLAVEKARAWLVWQDMPIGKLQVYVTPEYGTVQIQPRTYLGDDWDDYVALMREADGINYDWDTQRNYCDSEWVAGLSAFDLGVQLSEQGMGR